MPTTAPQLTFREVLRQRSVRRLWLAQTVSIFGDFLAVFAVFAVVTFNLHGTADQVTLILVSYFLPLAVISPVAGVFVDKWNVKWTMITSDLIRAGLVLLLLFTRNLDGIYGIFFALSVVSSFFAPAQSIAIRTITPEAGLMAANALMSQAIWAMQIIAPASAGLLVERFGANSCFLLDSASFVFSAAMVFGVAIHREAPAAAAAASSVFSSMRKGMTFIFTHQAISFVVISMTAGMFAVRCFGALLSVYVRDILHADAARFGLLNSLIGVGMIAGSQFMPRLGRKFSAQHLVSYGLIGIGAGVFITAVLSTIASTAIAMLDLGVFFAFIITPAQTLLQRETPRELLGRVSSSLMSVVTFAQVIALFVAGPVAQSVGIRKLYVGSAVLLALVGALGYRSLRQRPVSAPGAVIVESPAESGTPSQGDA